MKVGALQFTPHFGKLEENRRRLVTALSRSSAEGLDLVVLPELAVSGYNFSNQEEVWKLSEPAQGPTAEVFTRLAEQTGAHYALGFSEVEEDAHGSGETRIAEASGKAGAPEKRYYNSSMLVGPEGLVGVYRKAHIFYREKLFFSPGNSPFEPFDVKGVKVGLLVCFDHMFPEPARTLALGGTQVVCHPSNLVMPEYAQLTSRVRAIENKMFWLMANRCGSEPGSGGTLSFTGRSQLVDDRGKVLAAAGEEEELLLTAEIEPELALDKNINGYNNLFEERRVDLFRMV